jgi:hypothetical protein
MSEERCDLVEHGRHEGQSRPKDECASCLRAQLVHQSAESIRVAAFEKANTEDSIGNAIYWRRLHEQSHAHAEKAEAEIAALRKERDEARESFRKIAAWAHDRTLRGVSLDNIEVESSVMARTLATPAPAKSIDGLEDIIRVQKEGEK